MSLWRLLTSEVFGRNKNCQNTVIWHNQPCRNSCYDCGKQQYFKFQNSTVQKRLVTRCTGVMRCFACGCDVHTARWHFGTCHTWLERMVDCSWTFGFNNSSKRSIQIFFGTNNRKKRREKIISLFCCYKCF